MLVKTTAVSIRAKMYLKRYLKPGLLTKTTNKGDLSRDRRRVFNGISGAITSGKGCNTVIVVAIAAASATITAVALYDTVILPSATIIVYTPLLVACTVSG